MSDPKSAQMRALLERLQPTIRRAAKAIGARFHVDAEDLVGIGYMAAVEVTRTFDPSKNDDVTVFGYARIAGEMLDAVAKEQATDATRLIAVMHRFACKASGSIESVDPYADEEEVRRQLDAALASVAAAAVLGVAASRVQAPADDAIDASRLVAALERVLNALPGEQRALIRLVFFEGATLEVAATALGLSERTARRRKREALAALRDGLVAAREAPA
jgi:RNA polymerase sigma factor (sigma-70 family)